MASAGRPTLRSSGARRVDDAQHGQAAHAHRQGRLLSTSPPPATVQVCQDGGWWRASLIGPLWSQ